MWVELWELSSAADENALVQPLLKNNLHDLGKLNVTIPYDPAILLPSVRSWKTLEHVYWEIGTQIFTAMLCVIGKKIEKFKSS